MSYAFYDVGNGQFEDFVVELCHELLGPGVQGFGPGTDAGRDAKFVGTADGFPSLADPFVGTTIIQAKHTIDVSAKFSESSFSGDVASSVLSIEIPKVRALVDAGKLDNYMLFSNRRLSAPAEDKITERLYKEAGVQRFRLFGITEIERTIKRHPYLATVLRGYEHDLPLRASPDEFAEVITALASAHDGVELAATKSLDAIRRVKFSAKNKRNGLSEDYANHIAKNYLKHFKAVSDFLANPQNSVANSQYRDATDEFAAKLIAYRSEFDTYDLILEHLLEVLILRDADLRSNKRLARIVFYFMYWSCDIGTTAEESNASPN